MNYYGVNIALTPDHHIRLAQLQVEADNLSKKTRDPKVARQAISSGRAEEAKGWADAGIYFSKATKVLKDWISGKCDTDNCPVHTRGVAEAYQTLGVSIATALKLSDLEGKDPLIVEQCADEAYDLLQKYWSLLEDVTWSYTPAKAERGPEQTSKERALELASELAQIIIDQGESAPLIADFDEGYTIECRVTKRDPRQEEPEQSEAPATEEIGKEVREFLNGENPSPMTPSNPRGWNEALQRARGLDLGTFDIDVPRLGTKFKAQITKGGIVVTHATGSNKEPDAVLESFHDALDSYEEFINAGGGSSN